MRSSHRRRLLARPDGVEILELSGTDPLMLDVSDLCYETLHRPFGVTRQPDWDEADPASVHLAAVADGRLAGYARLITGGGAAHVRQVVVAPGFRGRGIAGDLVSCAVSGAAERGVPLAFLNARTHAVGVYERQGFHVVGAPFRMGRTYLPHVRMERTLR